MSLAHEKRANVMNITYQTKDFSVFSIEGYHNRINSRIHRNHPDIWQLINFAKGEEKRVQNICLQWSSSASKKKHPT